MNYVLCYVVFHRLDIAYTTEVMEAKYRRGFDLIDTSQGSYVVYLLSDLDKSDCVITQTHCALSAKCLM